jgi:flagellar motor switch protein FliG
LSHRNQSALKRIRGRRFTFEDLEHLSADDLSRITPRLKPSQLALALTGASDSLGDHVLATFPKRVGLSIEAEMASRGPVRLREVDAAQSAVADAARSILGKHTQPTILTA